MPFYRALSRTEFMVVVNASRLQFSQQRNKDPAESTVLRFVRRWEMATNSEKVDMLMTSLLWPKLVCKAMEVLKIKLQELKREQVAAARRRADQRQRVPRRRLRQKTKTGEKEQRMQEEIDDELEEARSTPAKRARGTHFV